MIITVTLNPSVDRTLEIPSLKYARVTRAKDTHLDPGGKGVNVSRALHANGVASLPVLPSGGEEGEQLVRLLLDEGVTPATVDIPGHTRSNISLVEPDGTVTKINEPGPQLSAEDLAAIGRTVTMYLGDDDWVVVSGRVPPGVSSTDFSYLCQQFRNAGARLAVDTSGPELRACLDNGVSLIKPNRRELSELVGEPLSTTEAVVNAAVVARDWGADTVLASLGSDGAVLVNHHGTFIGTTPVIDTVSSVGAGDAMLAGFLSHPGGDNAALIEALAWGTAAAALPGSRMPSPSDISRHGIFVRPHHTTTTVAGETT